MESRRGMAWVERESVAADGECVHYMELTERAPWIRVVKDERGTTFALFSFPDGDERERFVMVSPGRQGRATFYLNRGDRTFDYPAGNDVVEFGAGMAPTDVAMWIQRRYAPIPS